MIQQTQQQLIEEEMFSLKQAKETLNSLKSRWIKTSSVIRSIKTLEFYIQKKQRLISELQNAG